MRREALLFEWRLNTATVRLSQQVGVAEGSLIRVVPGRVGSGPDKAGTGQYCQMAWVRRARRRGVREEPASISPSMCDRLKSGGHGPDAVLACQL
jgi:hypothetical protein